MAIFCKYLYVDNVDEIFIRIRIFVHMHTIRMNRLFRICMANPNPYCNIPTSIFQNIPQSLQVGGFAANLQQDINLSI